MVGLTTQPALEARRDVAVTTVRHGASCYD